VLNQVIQVCGSNERLIGEYDQNGIGTVTASLNTCRYTRTYSLLVLTIYDDAIAQVG
jgi:hypothetical protein